MFTTGDGAGGEHSRSGQWAGSQLPATGSGKRGKRKGKRKGKRAKRRANNRHEAPGAEFITHDLGEFYNRHDVEHVAYLMSVAQDQGIEVVSAQDIVRMGDYIVAWDNSRGRYSYVCSATLED